MKKFSIPNGLDAPGLAIYLRQKSRSMGRCANYMTSDHVVFEVGRRFFSTRPSARYERRRHRPGSIGSEELVAALEQEMMQR